MEIKKLSLREEAVMDVIWEVNRPLTLAEIISNAPGGDDWKTTTTYKTLDSLMKKQYVVENGFIHSGRKLARLFVPIISAEDYAVVRVTDRIKKHKTQNQIGAARAIVSFLAKENIDNDKLVAELEVIINQLKKGDTRSLLTAEDNNE